MHCISHGNIEKVFYALYLTESDKVGVMSLEEFDCYELVRFVRNKNEAVHIFGTADMARQFLNENFSYGEIDHVDRLDAKWPIVYLFRE